MRVVNMAKIQMEKCIPKKKKLPKKQSESVKGNLLGKN
jgi:hypothetical protein